MPLFSTTPLPDLMIVTPERRSDTRGFFSETWNATRFREQGLQTNWCQDNHSLSRETGVLRGLHFQTPPMAQAKLVRCSRGRIWDVAVDVRRGSPGFRQWFGLELSAENWRQLYIPRGFLHGFLTLEPETEVQYKVDNPYAPDCEGIVRWDDPTLAISWPPITDRGTNGPILSPKDAEAPLFSDLENPFQYGVEA